MTKKESASDSFRVKRRSRSEQTSPEVCSQSAYVVTVTEGIARACHAAAGLGWARERCAEDTVPRSMHVGRNHLAQFSNSSLKSTLLALVSLVSLRHTGHLALKSLKPCYGFNYEGCASGWSNAGHETPHWYWSFGK